MTNTLFSPADLRWFHAFYRIARTLLFRLDPETVHHLALRLLSVEGMPTLLREVGGMVPPSPVKVWGIEFRNPVGLAAGFDKDAQALAAWDALGFGFVEIGTVTPRPQAGNPRPRIWRYPRYQALVNAMGFPNDGAAAVGERLQAFRDRGPSPMKVGVNLGKQKETPLEQAGEDYALLLQRFAALGDFFVINISSPNTPGLRQLQGTEFLERTLKPVAAVRAALPPDEKAKPVLVKIAPDVTAEEVRTMCQSIEACGFDGVVATNTSRDHRSLGLAEGDRPGGMSGVPLRADSTRVLRWAVEALGGRLPTIGCGGVTTRSDLLEKQRAGAALVEIYTSFIYRGPAVVAELLSAHAPR
jgi:dihydroorotate dehydrogenase